MFVDVSFFISEKKNICNSDLELKDQFIKHNFIGQFCLNVCLTVYEFTMRALTELKFQLWSTVTAMRHVKTVATSTLQSSEFHRDTLKTNLIVECPLC